MSSEELYRYPDPVMSRMLPWGASVVVSALLLYLVVASGRPTSPPEIERKVMVATAVVLPPPPDIREEPPPLENKPPPPTQFEFKTFSSEEAVTLLDVKIEPEKDQEVLKRLDVRLADIAVNMDEVNDNYVYEKSEVDAAPEVVHQVMPEVKTEKKGGQVRVRLMFAVDEKGKVGERYVLECTHPEVNDSVLKSLDLWTFWPAKKGRRVVRCWVRQTIVINLGSGSPLGL